MSIRTVSITDCVRQSLRKPIGFLVYDRGGENHYFEDRDEAVRFAEATLHDQDVIIPSSQWEVYPLFASHPRIVR